MKIYVEGGGDAGSLRTECREAFAGFLKRAGMAGKMPRIVACGSRADAFNSFCTAIRNGEKAMLLVDSEAPVIGNAQLGDSSKRGDRDKWQPWLHLSQRQGDGWEMPEGSDDLQCHLMVQCMEHWLLADRDALKAFFGQDFKENCLPKVVNSIEQISKSDVYQALGKATGNCKTKGAYNKGKHSFKLLCLIDPQKVLDASPWATRFVETLSLRMSP